MTFVDLQVSTFVSVTLKKKGKNKNCVTYVERSTSRSYARGEY